jgi:Immunoglobulin-like domain of bacterial spore germination
VAALVAATTASACHRGGGKETEPPPASSGSTTTTAASPVATPYSGIWPFTTQAEADAYAAGGDPLYRDPARTAVEFMRRFGGMANPVGSAFQAGDTGSGEVQVRPRASSPFLTTVTVRRTGPGATVWVVVAAQAKNIQLESPVALTMVTSPVLVSGKSSSFEGNVVVQVKEDGMGPGQFLGQEPLTGGSGQKLELFQGRVTFRTPAKPAGAVVALTESAEDGTVEQLSAVRVVFEKAST